MYILLKNMITAICILFLGTSCPLVSSPDQVLGGLVHNVRETYTEGLNVDEELDVSGDLSVTGTSTQATTTISSLTATNATLSSLTVSSCTGCGGGDGGSYTGSNFVVSTTASLDLGTTPTNNCLDTVVTATGAQPGDKVILGIPGSVYGWIGFSFNGFVSSTDAVTLRRCNTRASTSMDPPLADYNFEIRR